MSEAERTPETPPRLFETRLPFDLSDELRARVEALGLVETVEHVRENGYGYIHNAASGEFVERLRETIIRIAGATPGWAASARTCCSAKIRFSRRLF